MTGRLCFVTVGDNQPSSQWLRWAAESIGADVVTLTEVERGEEPVADLYVVEREIWRAPFRRWRARGAAVLCWFDDAYQYMSSTVQSRVSAAWDNTLSDFKLHLRQCDGFITPNALLAADFAPFNQYAFVIPNYHNIDNPPLNDGSYGLVIGWCGTLNHWSSWRDTDLAHYLPDHRLECTVRIVGNPLVANMIEDEDYRRVEIYSPMSYTDYLSELASWGVCLIPVHGPYDARRSWIKALECNLVGTPWIAVGDSAKDIYREVPYGIMLDEPHGEQDREHLMYLIDDSRRWYERGKALEWARHQHIREHVDVWEGVMNLCLSGQ